MLGPQSASSFRRPVLKATRHQQQDKHVPGVADGKGAAATCRCIRSRRCRPQQSTHRKDRARSITAPPTRTPAGTQRDAFWNDRGGCERLFAESRLQPHVRDCGMTLDACECEVAPELVSMTEVWLLLQGVHLGWRQYLLPMMAVPLVFARLGAVR